MQVDERAILRVMREFRGGLILGFTPARKVTAADVFELIDATNAAIEVGNYAVAPAGEPAPEDLFNCGPAYPVDSGVQFVAALSDTPETMRIWTSAFAAAMEASGWDGRLTVAREPRLPIMMSRYSIMTGVANLTGFEAPSLIAKATSGWDLNPAMADRLLHWAVTWVADGAERVYSSGDGLFEAPVQHIIDFGSRHTLDLQSFLTTNGTDTIRSIAFGAGRVVIQSADPGLPWRHHLGQIRSAILELADIAESGFIRFAYPTGTVFGGICGYTPERPNQRPPGESFGYYARSRGLDDRYLPDAYGWQLVGDRHLAHAHDLTRWNLTSIGGGLHQLQAPDPAAWYATSDGPTDAVLDQARTDFGDLILGDMPRF